MALGAMAPSHSGGCGRCKARRRNLDLAQVTEFAVESDRLAAQQALNHGDTFLQAAPRSVCGMPWSSNSLRR
jgi:hypothetical protein